MKTFLLSILAAAFVCLWAAPAWYDPLPATKLEKSGIGALWNNCSKPNDSLKLIKVEIRPNPPKLGQDLTILATIELKENVTGGHLEFSVNYGIIPVLRIKMELCIALKRFGLTCPISAGMYRNSTHLNIPRSLPGGHYTGSGLLFDQNGNELVCFGFNLYL